MHEAYNRVGNNDYVFGVFISGPSQTADIEQALVIGAHGTMPLTIILTKHTFPR
jgi:L-lactate dehydrogenase complex protein LldG